MIRDNKAVIFFIYCLMNPPPLDFSAKSNKTLHSELVYVMLFAKVDP